MRSFRQRADPQDVGQPVDAQRADKNEAPDAMPADRVNEALGRDDGIEEDVRGRAAHRPRQVADSVDTDQPALDVGA